MITSINGATRTYEIFGEQATANGFTPGSHHWWQELKRLRDDAHKVKVNGISIGDDHSAEVLAGQFVTAQLGNCSDSDWSPKATLLLLHTTVVFFGETQFTGIYKKADGSFWAAQFVTKQHERRYDAGEDLDMLGKDIGIMYCTSSAPIDMDTKSSRYLSATENKTLAQAMTIHRDKIALLPVSIRYKGAVPIDVAS